MWWPTGQNLEAWLKCQITKHDHGFWLFHIQQCPHFFTSQVHTLSYYV